MRRLPNPCDSIPETGSTDRVVQAAGAAFGVATEDGHPMRAGDARECSRRRSVGELTLRPVEVELRQHKNVCTLFRGGSRQPIEAGKRLRRTGIALMHGDTHRTPFFASGLIHALANETCPNWIVRHDPPS